MERRILTGIATTPSVDRQGDVIEPDGVAFATSIPLLLHHDSRQPVGTAILKKPTKHGIEFEAKILSIDEPGTLRDRLEEAWQSVKSGLIRGVSIGFRALETALMKDTGGIRFLKTEILELSLVSIPANQDAVIATIKHFDSQPAATGNGSAVPATSSGASDITRAKARTGPKMKTLTEKRQAFVAEKESKLAKMNDLSGADDGATMDAAQQEEFDTLATEIESIDKHLARLETMDRFNKANARPIIADTQEQGTASRSGNALPVITVKQNRAPGVGFARMAMCVALSRGNLLQAYEISKSQCPDDQEIHTYLKTAVAAGTTANTFGPVLQYTDFMGDFVDYLRPSTILGKFGTNGIPALRNVPFKVRVMTQTAGATAAWVGEGKPKPVSHGTYGTITLDFTKVAAITVLTQEEVRFVPSSETKVRDDLKNALAARIDQDFIDPANAGSANVKPASITYGIVGTAVSGADADAVRVDFKNMLSGLIAANIEPTSLVLIMSTTIALNLSLMLNALGQREFPDLTMTGGRLFGIPVIVSEYLTALGSPSTGMIVAVNANDVYLADEGGVRVDASSQASLQMDDSLTQDGAAGTGSTMVSLWQNNLLGLLAEREITWKLRRAAAVAYLSPVAYTPTT